MTNTSEYTCETCHQAPCFPGFDDCLKCAVATCLVEDPQYLDFARRTFAHDAAWLAQFEAEWKRQADALAAASGLAVAA